MSSIPENRSLVRTLRSLQHDCDYGTVLKDMLCDCLVFGVMDKKLQNRFLRELTLTYTQVRDMALAAETANKDSKQLPGGFDESGAIVPRQLEVAVVAHVEKQHCKPRSEKASFTKLNQLERATQSSNKYMLLLWRET